MKFKLCIAAATAALIFTSASMAAKDLGTPVNLPGWGTISVPASIYIQEGTQPMLTAQEYNNDMAQMFDTIYHAEPASYQIVEKDGAVFRYGYMLHYTLSAWDVKQIANGQQSDMERPDYLRGQGGQDLSKYVDRINTRLTTSLPAGFNLVQPLHVVKISGKTFYEGTVSRTMCVNNGNFTELLRIIAWQHGSIVDIAVVMGSSADESTLIATVSAMLENAQQYKKQNKVDF